MNQVELLLRRRRDGFSTDSTDRGNPWMRSTQRNGHVPGTDHCRLELLSLHVHRHDALLEQGRGHRHPASGSSPEPCMKVTPRPHRVATHGFRPRSHEGLHDLPDRDQMHAIYQINGTRKPP